MKAELKIDDRGAITLLVSAEDAVDALALRYWADHEVRENVALNSDGVKSYVLIDTTSFMDTRPADAD